MEWKGSCLFLMMPLRTCRREYLALELSSDIAFSKQGSGSINSLPSFLLQTLLLQQAMLGQELLHLLIKTRRILHEQEVPILLPMLNLQLRDVVEPVPIDICESRRHQQERRNLKDLVPPQRVGKEIRGHCVDTDMLRCPSHTLLHPGPRIRARPRRPEEIQLGFEGVVVLALARQFSALGMVQVVFREVEERVHVQDGRYALREEPEQHGRHGPAHAVRDHHGSCHAFLSQDCFDGAGEELLTVFDVWSVAAAVTR